MGFREGRKVDPRRETYTKFGERRLRIIEMETSHRFSSKLTTILSSTEGSSRLVETKNLTIPSLFSRCGVNLSNVPDNSLSLLLRESRLRLKGFFLTNRTISSFNGEREGLGYLTSVTPSKSNVFEREP